MAKIKKMKDHAGKTEFPVTVADAVLMGNGKTLKGELTELASKLIKLVGISNVDVESVGINEYFFSDYSHKIFQRISISEPTQSSDFREIPFYEGAIYSYGENLYTWDGTKLVLCPDNLPFGLLRWLYCSSRPVFGTYSVTLQELLIVRRFGKNAETLHISEPTTYTADFSDANNMLTHLVLRSDNSISLIKQTDLTMSDILLACWGNTFSTTEPIGGYLLELKEQSEIKDIKSELIGHYDSIYSQLQINVGGFWENTFEFKPSQNIGYSEPIPVIEGQVYVIKSASNRYMLKAAFFDHMPSLTDTALTSSINSQSDDVAVLSEQTITIPSGVTYMVVSHTTKDGLVASVKVLKQVDGIQELADVISEDINNLRQEVEDTTSSNILKDLAEVNLIIIYGQSLSVGADTQPPITLSNKYPCNYKLGSTVIHTGQSSSTLASMQFQPLTETTYETPASGCAEKLIELIQQEMGVSVSSKEWKNHKFVYASCGFGGASMAELLNPAGNLFTGLKNVIERVYNICQADNKTFNVPAFIWIQGEYDQKNATPYATYRQNMLDLRTNIDSYVKSLNSQSNDVKCICYQSCSSNTAFGTGISGNNTLPITHDNALIKMAVPMVQMELVRDNNLFSAAAPTYCLDHHLNDIHVTPANIHLTNVGSKMEGCIAAIALKRILFNEDENNGVVPLTYSVSGNDLIIKYEANTKPIRKETEFVAEVENLGFKVINTSDNDIITSVEVFNDSVTIHCNESPVGAIAVYGYNGDDGYDGRIKGGRGNIADNSGYIYSANIGKFHYLLNNYAYCFGFEIHSGINNIITQNTNTD